MKFTKRFCVIYLMFFCGFELLICHIANVIGAILYEMSSFLRSFQPGSTYTGLYGHKRWSEAENKAVKGLAKTKPSINSAVIAQLILRICFRICKRRCFLRRGSKSLESSTCPGLTAQIQDSSTADWKNDKSRVVRKPAFCICENKDADQLRGNREADQRLCFRYIDSTIPLLSKSEISSLYSSSVAVQPGLCQTWSQTPKTGFLRTRLIKRNIKFIRVYRRRIEMILIKSKRFNSYDQELVQPEPKSWLQNQKYVDLFRPVKHHSFWHTHDVLNKTNLHIVLECE